MKYVLFTILSIGTMMSAFARQEGEKVQEGKILTMEDIKSVQRQWNYFAPRGNLKINTKDKSKKLQ